MAIQMQTSTSAGGQQGGFMGALGRAVAGGTLFMTEYTAVGGPGLLAFAAKLPGQILPMEIAPGQGYMVHRHGFMCATIGVQFSIGFRQRLGAGVFGRHRFSHAATAGPGHGLGRAQRRGRDLRPAGRQHTARASRPRRDVPGVGAVQHHHRPRIQNAFFGGGGLLLAALTGPGRVWLQSMTMQHLAHAIQEYLPKAG